MFGSVIKSARKAQRMTQEQLARKVGCTRTTVCDWEGEKYPPTDVQKIAALEKGLELPACSLYMELAGIMKEEARPHVIVPPDLKTLQRRLCDLIGAIEKLHSECDTPEEVMRLLLDVGDNGEINHPENRAFIDLLETLAPLAGEILRSIRRGERVAS
ncbi:MULTISPECIES: helix-turn-helix domain-containing protein [Dethiosulfovibrio]|uniref:Helix-turn-helix domain-containing protein n=2 Tax=Dethiosulfovibrio TaxID=47054 RepID=A0ABS9EQY9_9BACT|nr:MULTISPECIES: helix-turn-helix domain-containing protein [Dethiosulfovibrio]MCF4115113.1 helix-turn-helix domain-containing protein [Dethiosulfovibrio russensis]MCF4143608.1 helix-turn-helix domain-containing protein [Dethiosulfovibrio marinus]MCF4146079.1 helix-turn-helix domain-containing protein [Dethiosulfovibrio acidaminovorans]